MGDTMVIAGRTCRPGRRGSGAEEDETGKCNTESKPNPLPHHVCDSYYSGRTLRTQ
jgi:hypothetical protein